LSESQEEIWKKYFLKKIFFSKNEKKLETKTRLLWSTSETQLKVGNPCFFSDTGGVVSSRRMNGDSRARLSDYLLLFAPPLREANGQWKG
jgi:hypothetical protein